MDIVPDLCLSGSQGHWSLYIRCEVRGISLSLGCTNVVSRSALNQQAWRSKRLRYVQRQSGIFSAIIVGDGSIEARKSVPRRPIHVRNILAIIGYHCIPISQSPSKSSQEPPTFNKDLKTPRLSYRSLPIPPQNLIEALHILRPNRKERSPPIPPT